MKNWILRLIGKNSPTPVPFETDPIPQDKAREYRQVAALVCSDLDLLLDISEQPDMTLERLRSQVKYVHGLKEQTIGDAKSRQRRYSASCLVFAACNAGMVRSDPVN
jgi:hypothetical protein